MILAKGKTKEDYKRICLQLEYQLYTKDKEIERLNNIKNKAIEYIMTELITEWNIKNGGCVSGSDLPVEAVIPLLKILKEKSDKE